MRISVAMATFNGERFIAEQLASLRAQTRLPDELVVCDDQSTDRTLDLVEQFARTAPFEVRIHRNERNLGFGDNFLRAASLCRGDWIAFCDQDDVWLADKLATAERYTHLPGRNVLVVAHNADVVDESLVPSGVRYLNLRKVMVCEGRKLPNLWVASGFTMLFRADLVRRIPYDDRGPDPSLPGAALAHDVWVCRIARSLGDIVILPQSLVLYRRHPATTTSFLAGGNQRVKESKGLFRQLRTLAVRGAQIYQRHADAAAYQAAVFGRLARDPRFEEWCAPLRSAEADYAALSEWLRDRSRLYGEPRFPRRIGFLRRLLAANGHLRFNGYSVRNSRKILKDLSFDLAIAVHGPR